MTTGRINQVYTNVAEKRPKHCKKAPPTRLDTIFPTNVVETRLPPMRGSPPRRAPTKSPQPGTRTVKTSPPPKRRARRQLEQEGKNSFKLPENEAGKSKFASLGGPRRRTGGHDVPGSGSTAPLHQKATRTTVRPPNSGATGKPATPTHIYKENPGDHAHDFGNCLC